MEILRQQHNSRGLTIVSDEAFVFFKYLHPKIKTIQTFQYLEIHHTQMLHHSVIQLQNDDKLLALWLQLFNSPEECICEKDTESEALENNMNFNEELMEYELEQCLVMDMLDKVLQYFASVHMSDMLSKYKDENLSKKKTVALRCALILGQSEKDLNPTKVKYQCGVCDQECMDMASLKDPQFKDHSVQCDKCDRWYHLICVHLCWNESELQDGSTLEYFCPTCCASENIAQNSEIQPSTSQDESIQSATAPSIKGKGHGKKVHPKNNAHKRKRILEKQFKK